MTHPIFNINRNGSGMFDHFKEFASINTAKRTDAIQFVAPNSKMRKCGVIMFQSSTDHAYALKRSQDDINANNEIRASFLKAITAKTGLSVDEMPAKLKAALKLGDYSLDDNGKVTSGKPLTAYRMNQVFAALDKCQAQIDQIKANKSKAPIDNSLQLNNNINNINDAFDNDGTEIPSNVKAQSQNILNDFEGKEKDYSLATKVSATYNLVKKDFRELNSIMAKVADNGKIDANTSKRISDLFQNACNKIGNGFNTRWSNDAHDPNEDYVDDMKKNLRLPTQCQDHCIATLTAFANLINTTPGTQKVDIPENIIKIFNPQVDN